MAHTGYTIQMLLKEIKIFLKDGRSLNGQIFVSEYSRLRAGHEKVAEFFENDALFFPFKTGEDIHLFSKHSVMFVEYESDEDLSIYKNLSARISLYNGSTMVVKIPIMVPSPAARLSDQVNKNEKFIQCFINSNNKSYLINKTNIISINEIR